MTQLNSEKGSCGLAQLRRGAAGPRGTLSGLTARGGGAPVCNPARNLLMSGVRLPPVCKSKHLKLLSQGTSG